MAFVVDNRDFSSLQILDCNEIIQLNFPIKVTEIPLFVGYEKGNVRAPPIDSQ